MPLLSFSVLKPKLLDGSKTQTIRRPRKKYDLKQGDKLYVWWKSRTKEREYLGESKVINIKTTRIRYLTWEDAVKDGFIDTHGFSAIFHLRQALYKLHPELHSKQGIFDDAFLDCFVNVVTFAPLNREEKTKEAHP